MRQDSAARAAPDIEAEMAALPYRVRDRAGFRPVRVAGESASFTDEGSDAGAGGRATITLSPSPQFRSLSVVPNVQRDQILRQFALNDPELTDAVVERLGSIQVDDTLRYEAMARGKAAGSGLGTIRTVTVLLSGGTPLSVVMTAPESRQDEIMPRLRSFVRSISGRP
ncbi:hypothetical protein [Microvirga sp. 17 mud 1-3]|uniref:hypothetical protein n=1 Tax=Microvirga sp. 17 mud 1-3 TaxID=2082949 RepID=UPI0013A52D57|nr:hypothetical protein [Microvirga sp. 17 mud 1-3]